MNRRNSIALVGAGFAGAAAAWRYALNRRTAGALRGEVVIITGGSKGLGLALAREFGQAGCKIAICARDPERLERARIDLQAREHDVLALPCDVTDRDQVQRTVDAAIAHFGRLDILVNNAGMIEVGPVENFAVEQFSDAMDTIFWGTVYMTLAALPPMLERRHGRIVNISSIGGKLGVPHLLPYASAKFAVAGFSQALAAEVRSKGVRVTAIFPGLMRTGSYVNALFTGQEKKEAEWFTLGATLPGASMNATRAARQIVAAVQRGEVQRTLSVQAKLAALFNGISPSAMTRVLALVAAALPDPKPSGSPQTGRSLYPHMHPAIRALSVLGRSAMQAYNQKA